MDLASKHWLRRFEHDFVAYCNANKQPLMRMYAHENFLDNFLYKMLHLTGLLFGHPIRPLFFEHPEFHEWPDEDKMKYIFGETLYHVYFYQNRNRVKTADLATLTDIFDEATASAHTFYTQFVKDAPSSFHMPTFFSTNPSTQRKLEKIINQRLSYATIIEKKFWAGASYNTFVFLDLVYYALWNEIPEKKYHERHEYIQLQFLKIIIASFMDGDPVNARERSTLNYFLSSAIVTEKTQDKLSVYLSRGLNVGDIVFNEDLPSIFRLIYLEMGILSALTDKEFSDADDEYINALAEKLRVDEDTKLNCFLMVESFIHQNVNSVIYLKNKYNQTIFGSSINQKLLAMVKKNKPKIIREISESRELLELLWKSQNTQLTKEEREKVRNQISDLIKTIPSLAIFMVPGGSILLPILLKILPEDLLKPSQFRN